MYVVCWVVAGARKAALAQTIVLPLSDQNLVTFTPLPSNICIYIMYMYSV